MDGAAPKAPREETGHNKALRIAQVSCTHLMPMTDLLSQIGPDPLALMCLFASPDTDFPALIAAATDATPGTPVVACTTAGEIGATGYEDGQIIAIGFPAAAFEVQTLAFEVLDDLNDQDAIDTVIQQRLSLMNRAPHLPHEFAFALIDGLSLREEQMIDLLASALGPMPLFGGSAGDGTAFQQTYLAHNGRVLRNAAILTMVRSRVPVKVFSHDHLVPTEQRMVVTSADPDARIVREINAEPAAQEYARLLGMDPTQLSPFIFAAHPVVVRLGDSHHVRSIQRVNDAGELVFFSAINEGMVLSLADHRNIAAHLDDALSDLAMPGHSLQIIGCDCMLRRIAAGQTQQTHEVSRTLMRHNVRGFSTYGEQIGALHVNQTLTGVALYTPHQDAAE